MKNSIWLNIQATIDLCCLVLSQMMIEPFIDELPAFLKLLLNLGGVVPMHVRNYPWGKPVELGRTDLQESWYRSHESNIESFT